MKFRLWWFAGLAAVFLIAALITHSTSSSYNVMEDFGLAVAAAFVLINVIDGFVELRNRRRAADPDEDKRP